MSHKWHKYEKSTIGAMTADMAALKSLTQVTWMWSRVISLSSTRCNRLFNYLTMPLKTARHIVVSSLDWTHLRISFNLISGFQLYQLGVMVSISQWRIHGRKKGKKKKRGKQKRRVQKETFLCFWDSNLGRGHGMKKEWYSWPSSMSISWSHFV